MNMETGLRLLVEFDGVYGGAQSKDIFCTPFRIEAMGEEEES